MIPNAQHIPMKQIRRRGTVWEGLEENVGELKGTEQQKREIVRLIQEERRRREERTISGG